MTLSWFRSRAASISSVALVSLVTLAVWSAAPHQDDSHDAAWGVMTWHDPADHSLGRAQRPSEQPIHCVLCQWTRSFRLSTGTVPTPLPAVERQVRVHVDVSGTPQQFPAAQPPLRAPPASPALA